VTSAARLMNLCFITAFAPACGAGEWVVTTWGEEYIEQGIPAEVFADGCSARFDSFTVQLQEIALLDGAGEEAGALDGVFLVELTEPGPQTLGRASAPATLYDAARARIAPVDGAPSVTAAGVITCGEASVSFDWSFSTDTTYVCAPEDLTLPRGGEATTELTIHGDHLFYDGLESPDALVRAEALADGVVTQAELDAVPLAPLGYTVGQYSDVTTLGQHVERLTRSLGHVDGEGHCQVSP
jgi:hypothetical protein